MSNFWPERWSRSLKKFQQWSLTREFLKQHLTEKQNGYLQGGRLREVAARRELTVQERPMQSVLILSSFNYPCSFFGFRVFLPCFSELLFRGLLTI